MAVTFTNVYSLRVTSAATANNNSKWLNTVDIYKTGGAPDPDDDIIVQFCSAIAANLWHDSHVIAKSLRNWSRGDIPLDEQGDIWSVTGLDLVGTAMDTYDLSESGPADTDICMLIHKQQATRGGRLGKMFLHNLYRADMVDNQVGRKPTQVSGLAGFEALVDGSFTDIIDAGFFGGAANPGYTTVHWSAKPGAAAPFKTMISSFKAIGVTEHQFGRSNG